MSRKIRFALIGTGGMAHNHAKKLRELRDVCEIAAVCDVDAPKAEAFCRQFAISQTFSDVDSLLDAMRDDIDAVINITPDRFHHALSLKVIHAGKHILCEKPLAENHADAEQMRDEAAKQGVVNMVNFSYRNAAAIQTAAELIQSGRIGTVRHLEASYLQSWLSSQIWGDWRTSPQWLWRLSTSHGSRGVLGDIGVHILDFVTYPVGPISRVHCLLKTYPKVAGNRLGDYPLDANDSSVITAEFQGGAVGTIHATRWATGHANSLRLRIYGDCGAIDIDLDRSTDEILVCTGKAVDQAEWTTMSCQPVPTIHERFIAAVQRGEPADAQPDFAQGARIQRILDACFESHEASAFIAID